MDFKVNDKFSSLEELEEAIVNYSKRNYVDLHKRDTRTLKQTVKEKKVSRDRVKNQRLKYYQLKYTYICGGVCLLSDFEQFGVLMVWSKD